MCNNGNKFSVSMTIFDGRSRISKKDGLDFFICNTCDKLYIFEKRKIFSIQIGHSQP